MLVSGYQFLDGVLELRYSKTVLFFVCLTYVKHTVCIGLAFLTVNGLNFSLLRARTCLTRWQLVLDVTARRMHDSLSS